MLPTVDTLTYQHGPTAPGDGKNAETVRLMPFGAFLYCCTTDKKQKHLEGWHRAQDACTTCSCWGWLLLGDRTVTMLFWLKYSQHRFWLVTCGGGVGSKVKWKMCELVQNFFSSKGELHKGGRGVQMITNGPFYISGEWACCKSTSRAFCSNKCPK